MSSHLETIEKLLIREKDTENPTMKKQDQENDQEFHNLQINSPYRDESGKKQECPQLLTDESQLNYKQLYEAEVKKTQQLTKELERERIKLKNINANIKIKGKLCSNCFEELGHQRQTSLIDDLKGFSTKFASKMKKKEFARNSKQIEQIHEQNQQHAFHNTFSMFQNCTIFGIKDENLKSFQNQEQEPQLLYSLQQPSAVDHQASKLVFPSGANIKKLSAYKAKNKAFEIMSSSYTHLKSFILRFKCQDNVDQGQYRKNQFLMHLNPEKQLFCICIGINDYTSVGKDLSDLSLNYTLNHSGKRISKEEGQRNLEDTQFIHQFSTKSISSTQSQSNVNAIISQRVFCISSYYPFFTFFQQILKSLINLVKIERLLIYKHQDQDIRACDSQFQLNRMKELFQTCLKTMSPKKLQFNNSYELKLINHQKITLLTDWNLAKNYFVDGWIFTVLSLFNIDTFIDVFTLLMLQDRIVFVCDNSHILTYTIYLFVSLLTKPFMYAFQVVNIIPEEEFLGAPFPIVYGMLKKRKYLEEKNIMQIYKNTYVFLQPDRVDVVCTESRKDLFKAKSIKLKNDLSNLFKDLKKNRKIVLKPTKYEVQVAQYPLTSTLQERQQAILILEKVNNFLSQEIVSKLPNQIEVKKLKNSIDSKALPQDKDQNSFLMEQISYSLKKNVKDPFFEKFLDTQMMSSYIFK